MTSSSSVLCVGYAAPERATVRALPLWPFCEALQRRAEWHGQTVSIRGPVAAGPHGDYMSAPRSCQCRIVANDQTWANRMYLGVPGRDGSIGEFRAPYAPDIKALNAISRLAKEQGYVPSRDRLIVTYEGLFLTFSDEELTVRSTGGMIRGFGPPGLDAPAMLMCANRIECHGGAWRRRPVKARIFCRESIRRPDWFVSPPSVQQVLTR